MQLRCTPVASSNLGLASGAGNLSGHTEERHGAEPPRGFSSGEKKVAGAIFDRRSMILGRFSSSRIYGRDEDGTQAESQDAHVKHTAGR